MGPPRPWRPLTFVEPCPMGVTPLLEVSAADVTACSAPRRYVLYRSGTSRHTYCEAAAAVFIFGWMHTIAYVKLFKDWHAFASIFKRIVAKDVTKFAYIFIFVLLRSVQAAHCPKSL